MDRHLKNGIEKLQETMTRFNLRLDQIVPAVRHLMAMDNKMTRDEIRSMDRQEILDWWTKHTEEPEDENAGLDMHIQQEQSFSYQIDEEESWPEEEEEDFSHVENEEHSEELLSHKEEEISNSYGLIGGVGREEESSEELSAEKDELTEEQVEPMERQEIPDEEESGAGTTVGMIYRSMDDYEQVVRERENQQGKLSSGIYRLQQTITLYGLTVEKVIPQVRHLMEMDPEVPLGKIQYMDPREVVNWWFSKIEHQKAPHPKKTRGGLYDYTEEYQQFLQEKKQQRLQQQVLNYERRNLGMMVPIPPKDHLADLEGEGSIERNRRTSRQQKKRYFREKQSPPKELSVASEKDLTVVSPVEESIAYSQELPMADQEPEEKNPSMHTLHLSELQDCREMFEDGIFNEDEYKQEKEHILISLREHSDPTAWKTELRLFNHWKKEQLISEEEFQQEKLVILKARKR